MNLNEKKDAILQNNKKLTQRMLNDVLECYDLVGKSFKIFLSFGIDGH
jgi:hypothetical protein